MLVKGATYVYVSYLCVKPSGKLIIQAACNTMMAEIYQTGSELQSTLIWVPLFSQKPKDE